MKEYHRHLGVYGVCYEHKQLLVVHKTRGPYKNRYDLPGGSIEANESITQAIYREFVEETGLAINIDGNIGTTEFIIRYNINNKTHIQHIAIFLRVSIEATVNEVTISDDTFGSEWIYLEDITSENSSPLVVAAKEYLETNKLQCISMNFDNWIVNE